MVQPNAPSVQKIREKVQEEVVQQQEKYKEQHDKRKYVGNTYDIGKLMVVRAPTVATGESTK